MQPTEDERVLAALAHASIVTNAFNLAGLIGAALIWSTERERSPYVRAHAFQAFVYQGIMMLCTVLLLTLWGVCVGLSFLPALLRPDLYRDNGPPALFWLALLGLLVPLAFVVAGTLYALYGAYQAYRGRPFRYSLTSRLIGRDQALQPATTTTPPDSVVDAPAAEANRPADAAPQSELQAPIDPSLAPDPFAEAAPQSVAQALDPVVEAAPSQSVSQAPIDPSLAPDPLDLAPPDEPIALVEAGMPSPTPEPVRSEETTGTDGQKQGE